MMTSLSDSPVYLALVLAAAAALVSTPVSSEVFHRADLVFLPGMSFEAAALYDSLPASVPP